MKKKLAEKFKKSKLTLLLNLKKAVSVCITMLLTTTRVYADTFNTSSMSAITDIINLVCKLIFVAGVLCLIYGGLSYLSAYKADSAEGKEKASKELVTAVGLMILGGSSTYFTGKIS